MIHATLAQMRNSATFFETNEVIHIFNGRKKEELGFFVPKVFAEEFKEFLQKIEKKQKMEKLQRVALAQSQDLIEEGAVEDGIV